jgi:hypothetical protein
MSPGSGDCLGVSREPAQAIAMGGFSRRRAARSQIFCWLGAGDCLGASPLTYPGRRYGLFKRETLVGGGISPRVRLQVIQLKSQVLSPHP